MQIESMLEHGPLGLYKTLPGLTNLYRASAAAVLKSKWGFALSSQA
jgi:hypothetical protein